MLIQILYWLSVLRYIARYYHRPICKLNTTEVGCNIRTLSIRNTEKGKILTPTPKSNKSFSNVRFYMLYGMVRQLKSLYFGGTLCWNMELMFSVKNALFWNMNAFLFNAKVFKKLDIRGHLFNSVNQRDVNTYLFKNLYNLTFSISLLRFN